jgi:hypothetical protein
MSIGAKMHFTIQDICIHQSIDREFEAGTKKERPLCQQHSRSPASAQWRPLQGHTPHAHAVFCTPVKLGAISTALPAARAIFVIFHIYCKIYQIHFEDSKSLIPTRSTAPQEPLRDIHKSTGKQFGRKQMEMALIKLFISFLLLLLQLVPTTKSVSQKHEIIPADPQSSKNAEINCMKEEMDAVGDNISALYIVRKINERATALKTSKANAIEKMQALHGHPSQIIKALEEKLAKAENLLLKARSAKPIEVDVDGPADQQVPQVVENANRIIKLARRKTAVDDLNKKLTDAKKSREIDKKLVSPKSELINR